MTNKNKCSIIATRNFDRAEKGTTMLSEIMKMLEKLDDRKLKIVYRFIRGLVG